jgi:hypothetical protein
VYYRCGWTSIFVRYLRMNEGLECNRLLHHDDFGGEREKQFWITRDRVGLQNQTECLLEMRIKLLIVVSNLLACQRYSYSALCWAQHNQDYVTVKVM